MFTRSGTRSTTMLDERRRQPGERRRSRPARPPCRPRNTFSPAGVAMNRSTKRVAAGSVGGLGGERGAGVGRRDHEVDLSRTRRPSPRWPRAADLRRRPPGAGCTATARGRSRSRSRRSGRRRSPASAVPELGEQRRQVAHHPLRGEVRQSDVEVDLDHAGGGDQRPSPTRGCGPRRRARASRRRARGRPRRACRPGRAMPRPASQPPGVGQARRVARVVAGAHVEVAGGVAHRPGEAAEHDGSRPEERVRARGDAAVRALHAEQAGVAGGDADRPAAVAARSRASPARPPPPPRCRPTSRRRCGRAATGCGSRR